MNIDVLTWTRLIKRGMPNNCYDNTTTSPQSPLNQLQSNGSNATPVITSSNGSFNQTSNQSPHTPVNQINDSNLKIQCHFRRQILPEFHRQ